MLGKIKKKANTTDPEKLAGGKNFNFNTFKNSLDFASNIYYEDKTSLKDTKNSQHKMFGLLNEL